MKGKKIKKIFKNAVKEAFIELIDEVEGNRKPTFLASQQAKWKREKITQIEQFHKDIIEEKFQQLATTLENKLSNEKLKVFYEHIKNKNFQNPDDAIDFLLARKRWKENKSAQTTKHKKKKGKKMKAELSLDGKRVRMYDVVIYPTDED